jgi:two-component system chemotaxis response regulator CheY
LKVEGTGPVQKNLLIVEDNFDLQLLMQTRLEMEGYCVSLAQDGLEALALLERERPCLILLDLGLPLMDGYTLLDTIECLEGPGSIPVIVITADILAGSRLANKPVEVLYKPFNSNHLLAVIERCCASLSPRRAEQLNL